MIKKDVKTVIIGDIAFNLDITPYKKLTSIGGAAYYSAVGAMAAYRNEKIQQSVGVVAVVGGDFDLNHLKKKSVDSQGIKVVQNGKTCHFTITQYRNNTRTFQATRNVAETVQTDSFPSSFLSATHIHLATSLPQNYEVWQKFLKNKTEATISADAFETFATQFPELTVEVLNKSDLIFINAHEADLLARKGLRTDIPWVLKRGDRGATYINNGISINISAPKVQAIETTGAGDVLAGAFLSLLSVGYEIESALQIAVQVASKSVTQFGVEHVLN